MDPDIIRDMIMKGRRIDGRRFDEHREITFEQGVISSAEGSARVKIGKTEVIAGIKMDVGEPFPDTPDEGILVVNSEFVPFASPEFEPGPPDENSIELSRVVDRTIRESKALDFKKLCIKQGEKVWAVFIDIDVIDYDGNLIDAASLAALLALLNTKMPRLEDDKPVHEEKGKESLPISGKPLAVTVAKIGGEYLIDPNHAEEKAMDARLVIGTVDTKNGLMLCAMQKGGEKGLTYEDVEKMIELGMKKTEEIRKMIK